MEDSNRQTNHTEMREMVEKLIQQVVENEAAKKQETAQQDIEKLKTKTKSLKKQLAEIKKEQMAKIATVTKTIKRIEKEKNEKIKELEEVIQTKAEYQETIEKRAEIATKALKDYMSRTPLVGRTTATL